MFEKKLHSFSVSALEFTIRAKSIRDRMSIQSRKQAICFEQSVFYDLLDVEYREWIDETAILETLLEAAPPEWYLEVKQVNGEMKKLLRTMSNEALDYDLVREVGAAAHAWLETF